MNLPINTIINADCLVEMPKIPDKSIDMILCDLPYGTTTCSWDTIIPFEPLWKEYKRIIKDNGAIVLTASQPFTSALVMSNPTAFSHQWIWEKEQGSNPLTANKMPMKNFEDILVFYEDYRDLSLSHPLRKYSKQICEYIGYSRNKLNTIFGNYRFQHFLEYAKNKNYNLIQEDAYNLLVSEFDLKKMDGYMEFPNLKKIDSQFSLSKRVYNPQKNKGKKYTQISGKIGEVYGGKLKGHITNNSGERYPTAILKYQRDKSKFHPTQKPVALFEYLIKTYTNEGDLVLDNCAGSGTTGVACKNLKRNFILIEKEKEYCAIAQKRLDTQTGNLF